MNVMKILFFFEKTSCISFLEKHYKKVDKIFGREKKFTDLCKRKREM